MNDLTKMISVNSRHPCLLSDEYTLVFVSSSNSNRSAIQFPSGRRLVNKGWYEWAFGLHLW